MANKEWKHKRRERSEWLTASDFYEFVSVCYDKVEKKNVQPNAETFKELISRINKNSINTNVDGSQK